MRAVDGLEALSDDVYAVVAFEISVLSVAREVKSGRVGMLLSEESQSSSK